MKKQIFSGLAIALLFFSCKKPDPIYVDASNNIITLSDELKAFAPEAQTATVSSDNVISFTTEAGNIITFPANAFVDKQGNPITGNVELSITEITNISDMILSGMMTNSNQGPLSSQGEFNVKVTQNGEELDLAEGATFNITNPNTPLDTAITGWEWIPDVTQTETGVTTETSTGEWVQNEFDENNKCDIINNLLFSLNGMDPTTNTQNWWNTLQQLRNNVMAETFNELQVGGNAIYSIGYSNNGDSVNVKLNTNNDGWEYHSTGVSYYFDAGESASSSLLDAGQVITINPCNISTGWVTHNYDPNVISIEFNNLSWCNIDRLLYEFGTLWNCKLKTKGIPTGAIVNCVFKEMNGVVNCWANGNEEFTADRLPDGMEILFLVYFRDGDKIKCGTQTITATAEMEFDETNLKTLNDLDELVEEINKLTE